MSKSGTREASVEARHVKADEGDGHRGEAQAQQRKGRERNGKQIGRYFMCVQVRAGMAQVGVLEDTQLQPQLYLYLEVLL